MATKEKVEVVTVTHNQLKRRVESLKKDAGHHGHERRDVADQKEKAASQLAAAEKAEKHPTKSHSTKARKEKEQRKPDQQLYRPGMSRIAKNSSSPGSDLNSSREESPTKPVQDPVHLSEIGSKGDQACHVHEESQSKEPAQEEEAMHEAVHSKNQGHERSGAENAQRGDKNGSRNDRFDRRADRVGSHAHSGSRPRDKQEPLHHREQRGRPGREESSKVSRVGKAPSLHNENAEEDTWEIKPEDWETETTSKSSGIKVSKAQSPPKHAQSRNRNQSHQHHVQGQNRNESPPKQVHSRNGKGRHGDDIKNKERKQNIDDDDPKVPENRPQEVESLMGSDWDKEFEQQYQAQQSPKKTDTLHKVTKQNETAEQLPQSRRASWKSNTRQDHGPRTSSKKSHSYSEFDSSQHEPKRDLVKSSRQNYASEIQKLRAKKEMMEKENSSQEEFETVSSAKDLQITVKTGSEVDERPRLVQEKPAKSSSTGQSRQRIDTDISISKRNEKTDKGPVLTMSGEWEEEVDDLNFHVESMVITNRKFQKKDSDKRGKFERPFQERRPPNSDERYQNEHYDDRDRPFERPDIEETRPTARDERSQMKNRDERGHGRSDNRRPPNRNDRFQNRDHSERDFERPHDDRRRPPDRDERYQNEHHDDRAFERPNIKETRPPTRDERSQMKNHDEKGYERSDDRRPPQRNDRFQDRDHGDRDFEKPREDRRRLQDRGEKQTIQHDSQRFHSGSSNEGKDQRNNRHGDKDEPYLSGNESRYRDREESHGQGHIKQYGDSRRFGKSGSDRQYRNDEDLRRSGNGHHEDVRKAPDKRHDEDGHHRGGEPQRHQKEQDERRRYHSGGKKETRRRDRISVSSDDSSERQGRRRGSSEAEELCTKYGGGILRLPGKTEQENPQPHGNYAPVYDQFYHPPEEHADIHVPVPPDEPKAKAKGRTGDQSRLWDPSKPNQKPALQQHQMKHGELHFQDPDSDKGESREVGTPPAAQQENWNSYIPNCPPGFAGMMPPPYGYPPPPPGYSVPTSSWENQSDGAQTYKSANPPLPLPYLMQYPPPYGRQPHPLPPGIPYHAGYQNQPHAAMMQEQQSVNRQSAQKLLRDAARCETDLFNALSHGISTREMLQQLQDKQQELEQLYEGIILLDLDLCNQYNVEQMLWKNCYYQIIEALRKAIQEQPNGDSYKEDLLDFMHHGTAFYEGVLNKLQSTYHFQLENRTGLDPLHEEPRRSIKLALLSAQRCMIALGDIARYKEQANETNNYGKARSWYMKAQHLAPRNGRPYNQLAILALYTRRKLDAVYFYVRSLAATNPFLTARESLMTLFEEVRRKVAHKEQEEIEARRDMERRREQRRKRRRRSSQDENRGRKEVWIAHDGRVEGGERMEEEEEDEIEKGENLSHLSAAELNKKFVLSFLNVHGKLFTKTGMEAFGHARDHLLREFKALLDHSPSAILSTRLIQLMAINMFAVANISPSGDSPPTAEGCPPLLQQAILLGLHMFALLCLRCCSLLQDHLGQQSGDQSVLSQDLHELLPGVKVYADWMMCHPKLWNPPPSSDTTSYSASLDVWSSVAQFLNLVKRVAVPDVQFAINGEQDSLEVLLPEDMALSGFVPLMALPLQPVFIQADTSKILANDRVRLDSLTMFGEYLSGQETPLISFSVKTDSYISVVPKAPPRRETDHSYHQEEDHERGRYDNDDVIVMDSYMEDEAPHGDGTISRLRERRDSLEKQLRDRELRDAHIQAIVESHRSQRLLEIVIKPYYLIPDTNCFIDHLPAIQRLMICQRYLMVVPLVVINELDGLARGSREGQYSDPHHAVKVQHGARYAVEYLEEEFANRNRYLCALTSKGSMLDSIRFRSEDADWRGNNDDHILRCCMHYCSDDPRQYMPADKDAPLQIKREVVLLTDDRNLRVKAIQQNVPVRDIIMFIRWAKV